MPERSVTLRLLDMLQALERCQTILDGISLEVFASDWQRRWMVERGVEIVPEASRYVSDEIKHRHPEIPWRQVAGIGNILRHDYEQVAPPILWNAVVNEMTGLEQVLRAELDRLGEAR